MEMPRWALLASTHLQTLVISPRYLMTNDWYLMTEVGLRPLPGIFICVQKG